MQLDIQEVINALSERGFLEWELASLRVQVKHLQAQIDAPPEHPGAEA